jgi:hypothetical protein
MADRGSPLSLLHLDETYSGVPLQSIRAQALENKFVRDVASLDRRPSTVISERGQGLGIKAGIARSIRAAIGKVGWGIDRLLDRSPK